MDNNYEWNVSYILEVTEFDEYPWGERYRKSVTQNVRQWDHTNTMYVNQYNSDTHELYNHIFGRIKASE